MIKNYLYIGILIVVLSSCSGFEKIRKSSDYNMKYRKALEYYNKGDYNRAYTLLDEVAPLLRGSNSADTINYYLAYSAYGQKDYTLAGYHFSNFAQVYAYSPFAEEAEYMAAYCYYLDSPGPSLDQENTMKAIETFKEFLRKNPQSKFAEKGKQYLSELQEKLVEKSFRSAKLYYDMENYKSSIVALKSSLEQYPSSKYREEQMWYVVKSNYMMAENSIEAKRKERFQATVDEYYSFISEFPKSEFKKDADKIYEVSQKFIK